MASEHDKRYKKLFQNPYFVQKLLESQSNRLPDEVDIGKIRNIGELKPMLEIKLERLKKESVEKGRSDIIIRMREKGLSKAEISALTGFTVNEIELMLKE